MRSLDAGGFYINFIEKYTKAQIHRRTQRSLTHTHMRIKAEK